jgi:threonine synthase
MLVARFVGHTPCVELPVASAFAGCRVFGKIESVNPTGSHKDRESVEVLQDAVSNGFREVGCASTGNAGISLATLSRMTGLRCHVYISSGISPEKLSLIRASRPVIHIIRGDYGEALEEAKEEMRDGNIYAANPGQCIPKIEGNRNIGREISKTITPDVIVCPTNNGTHFIGVWEGITENKLSPLAVAATARTTRIADIIHGFHKYEGKRWTDTLKRSHARVVDVNDEEIKQALRVLLRDGIVAEPAAATGVAALKHVKTPKASVACCTITGSGLKFPRLFRRVL